MKTHIFGLDKAYLRDTLQKSYQIVNSFINKRSPKSISLIIFLLSLYLFIIFLPGYAWKSDNAYNHTVIFADSLIHGHLDVDGAPALFDLAEYNGHRYFPFPPLPALILCPLILIFGYNINLYLVNAIVFGLTGVFFFRLLRTRIKQSNLRAMFFTIIFLFGTNLWWCASRVSVYVEQHIFATLFIILLLYELYGKRRLVLLAIFSLCAFLCRYNLMLLIPFVIYTLYRKDSRERISHISGYLTILVIGFCLFGFYNIARFDNPFEPGYQYIIYDPNLQQKINTFGVSNITYLWTNIYTVLFATPIIRNKFPFLVPSEFGMSMFLTTPLLLLLLKNSFKKTHIPLIITTLLIFGSQLLYHNNGWYQFGYRFALDFMPFLFILIIQSIKKKVTKEVVILGTLSILINMWGILTLP